MANQTYDAPLFLPTVFPNDHAAETNAEAIVNTSNSNQSVSTALNNGGVNGYLYGAGQTTYSRIFQFRLPSVGIADTTAQLRSIQFQGNVECGYQTTSLPMAFSWTTLPAYSSEVTVGGAQSWAYIGSQISVSGNVYAFSTNATKPTTTGTTANPSGGADSAGTNALNSILIDPKSLFSLAGASLLTTRGWPEWYKNSNNALISPASGGLFTVASWESNFPHNGPNFIVVSEWLSAQLILGSSTSPIPTQGFNITNPLFAVYSYNQAPSAGTVTASGQSGTVTLDTLVPNIGWTYSDPENDPQAGFVVIVWPSGKNAGNTNQSPFWTSGLISSASTTYTIPSGVLAAGQSYTIEVLVTDNGSQTRYNAYGSALVNVNTSGVNPILTPGFTPQWSTTSSIQPSYLFNSSSGALSLSVKPRLNNLNSYEALFTNSSGVAAVIGTWGGATVTATTSGNQAMATSTSVTWTGTTVGVLAGSILTGQLTVNMTTGSGNKILTLGIQFFDLNGTSLGTVTRKNYTNATASPINCWVQCPAPQGATSAALTLTIAAVVNDVYVVSNASITNDCLNVLTNGDFENGATFWSSAQSGTATLTAGSSGADGDYQAPMGSLFYQLVTPKWLTPTALPGVHGTKFLMSGALSPAPGNLQMFVWANNVAFPATTSVPVAGPASGSGWGRGSQIADTTGLSTTIQPTAVYYGIGPGAQGGLLTIQDGGFTTAAENASTTLGSWYVPQHNFLTLDDSSFESTIGTWTAGSNTTIALTNVHQYVGSNSLKLTATALGNAVAQTGSNVYAVTGSINYAATAAFLTGSTSRVCTIAMGWYTSGGVFISGNTSPAVTDTTTQWTIASITAQAPSNAAFVFIQAVISGCAASEVHYLDGVMLQRQVSASYSNPTVNTIQVTSGFLAGFLDTVNDPWIATTGFYAASPSFTYSGSILMTGTASLGNSGSLQLLFYDANSNLLTIVAGNSLLVQQTHTTTLTVTGVAPANTASVALAIVDSSANEGASTTANYNNPQLTTGPLSTATTYTADVDNLMFVPVWPLTNLNLQTAIDTNIASVSLGAAENTTGWYQDVAAFTGGNGTTDDPRSVSRPVFTGESLSLEVSPGTVASQLFTVSGYTSLALSYRYLISAPLGPVGQIWGTTPTASLSITFYSIGGIPLEQTVNGVSQLSQSILGTTTGGWTLTPTSNITVPPFAAYAKISLSALGGGSTNVYYTDISVTPTGSLSAPPYASGGWSEGLQDTIPALVLQRSNDGGNTWQTVRYNGETLAASATTSPFIGTGRTGFTAPTLINYTDYEWQAIAADVLESSTTMPQYRAFLNLTNVNFLTQGSNSPTHLFYRPALSDWWLIDPSNLSSSILLHVKDVKFSTTENMAKSNGLGRKRVVVTGDVVQGDVITLDLFSFTTAEYTAYRTQFNKQSTLLLRSPDGEQWYVRPTRRDRERVWTGSYSRPLRTYAIELQEVDPLL